MITVCILNQPSAALGYSLVYHHCPPPSPYGPIFNNT